MKWVHINKFQSLITIGLQLLQTTLLGLVDLLYKLLQINGLIKNFYNSTGSVRIGDSKTPPFQQEVFVKVAF